VDLAVMAKLLNSLKKSHKKTAGVAGGFLEDQDV